MRKTGTGKSLEEMEGPKKRGRVGRPRKETAYDTQTKSQLKKKHWPNTPLSLIHI